MTRKEKQAHIEKMNRIHAESQAIVMTGKCPQCGAKLHRNLALTGWWQCDRSGDGTFRRDATGNKCGFQCFTEY